MTDQSKFEVKFEKGDRLVHPRGATAEVLEVAKHKHDRGTVYGYRLRITQADGKVQESTIPLMQFTGKGWRLSLPAEEAAAQSPAEPVVAENEIPPAVIAIEPLETPEQTPQETAKALAEADQDTSDPRDWEAARRDYERELYRKIDAEDAAEMNPPDEDEDATPYDVMFAEMKGDWNIVYYRNGDTQLERKVENKTGALKIIADLEASRLELASLAQVIERQRSQIEQLQSIAALYDNLLDRASQPVGMADPNPYVAPKVEIRTLNQKIGTSEAIAYSDHELADLLNQGWEKWDCAVNVYDGYSYRIVTLQRYCHPSPAPEPLKAAAKVVVPSAILEPEPLATASAQINMQAAEFTLNQVADAEEESPLPREVSPIDRLPHQSPPRPRFKSQTHMAKVLTEAMQAGQQVYDAATQSPARALRPELAALTPVRG